MGAASAWQSTTSPDSRTARSQHQLREPVNLGTGPGYLNRYIWPLVDTYTKDSLYKSSAASRVKNEVRGCTAERAAGLPILCCARRFKQARLAAGACRCGKQMRSGSGEQRETTETERRHKERATNPLLASEARGRVGRTNGEERQSLGRRDMDRWTVFKRGGPGLT